MPIYVTYFVTNKCNLKCQHCFYSTELNQPKKELTLNEINDISKTMGSFLVLLYSGGEPFLRKDLPEITQIFYTKNRIKYLSIPTNGMLLQNTEEIVTKICDLCPKLKVIINYSIDGLEKIHDTIRGVPGAFNNAISTFKHMKSFKQKYPNLKLGFTITLNTLNQNEIFELYDYLKSLSPDNIGVNLVRGTPKNLSLKEVDLKKYVDLNNKIQADLTKGVLPGHGSFLLELAKYKYNFINKIAFENKYISPCYASTLACVIYPDGDVYPCEMLNKKIGNIRDYNYDFKKLWYSSINKELANWIKNTNCFCTHECNVGCNVTFNIKHLSIIGFNYLKNIRKLIHNHK